MARARKSTTTGPYPPGWEPFLAAINAHLDDDTPRLVFADWLQENGDEPRAEFIRLQCGAARGDSSGAARAEALLAEHRARWLLGLPKELREHPEGRVFRRGFVAAVTVRGNQWLSGSIFEKSRDAGGRAIRRVTALEEVRFEQVWNEVVACRSLAGLRVLTLPSAASGILGSLAKSPILPTLTDLTIVAKSSDGLAQWAFRDFFASKKLTRLRRFRFESMRRGDLVAAGLANPLFANLEELRLRHLSLNAHAAESLAHSPALTNLRVLDLLNNQIGDAGLRELLASPGLRKLEELGLDSCQLTPASAPALANWEGLRSVRVLDLRGNRLRATDAEIIARSPHARNLTDLRVVRRKT